MSFVSISPRHSPFVQRRDPADLTPEYEDAGLFKTEILQVTVNLTPIIFRNSRHDLIVRGFGTDARNFEVTFAGRRVLMAAPLISSLEAMKRSVGDRKKSRKIADVDLENMRLPVTVQGAWRRRHWMDGSGWQAHVHQLVAARWSVLGPNERVLSFGALPAIAPPPLPTVH